MSSKRVGVLVALMYITGEVQLVNVALLSVRFSFALSVMSNTLPFPSLRLMLVKIHPAVDVFRWNVEGEMRSRGEEERVIFTKEMSVSVRFPFFALIRDEDSSVVDVPMN